MRNPIFCEFCEKCGRKLNPKDIAELELDTRDNTYHRLGETPEKFSQGVFTFGRDCAKTILKNKGNING